MAVYLHNEAPRYELKGKKRRIRNWIKKILEEEHKKTGEINVILTKDAELLKMNMEFLQRNNYTDVIAFEYSGNPVSGDVYISMDRVIENAGKYGNKLEKEMLRVMAHGILHLCGYRDELRQEKAKMRNKEEEYLKKWEK